MTEEEKNIWKSTIEKVLIENESWDDKNKSERYHVVYKDIIMPPKVVLARAFDIIEDEHPETPIKSVSGGVETNQFIEEFGFKITEDLKFKSSDLKKLKSHIDKKVKNKKLFEDFIRYGSSFLSQLDIEVYKVRMAIEQRGIMTVIVGVRAAYSYIEVDDFAQIGFLVSKSFKKANALEYNFVYDYDYKGDPQQDFVKIQVQNWNEIDSELLEEHINQFQLQYDNIRDSKLTQWKVEANTTNNALKYLMFTNENINSFMNNENINNQLNIEDHRVYKLSMGTFLKTTAYRKAKLLQKFEESQWAVMGRGTSYSQGENWMNEAVVGDYAYITYGRSKLSFIVRFSSNPKELPQDINNIIGNTDFAYREYEVIKNPIINNTKDLVKNKQAWLPSGYSTFKEITNLKKANNLFFKPYYDIKLVRSMNKDNEDEIESVSKTNMTKFTLNQILYGPPGTGKTYETIAKAISIVAPNHYEKNKENRKALTSKFKELTINNWSDTKGQIAFCTFHQSFTYEDFVEGIKPKVINEKDIIYEVEKGIFKALCDRARTATNDAIDFDNIINKLQNKILADGEITLSTDRGNMFDVNYTGQTTFRIRPHESTVENPQYPASIENIRMLYQGAPLTDLYNPSYVKGILEYLFEHYKLPKYEEVKDNDKPYVIVIDEINRGNLASIFGELITLIEPDKRSGADEELSVILPYSKKEFSVPNNVYIIGTMNTADRSVEALDSALRRRFSFKEVMPNNDVIKKELAGKNDWEGTKISLILERINQRVTRLIDRDHQIGHSYFLKLKKVPEEKTTDAIKTIFSENIIPLLQEYFFNDFNKIALVLGEKFLKKEEVKENIFAKFSEGDISDYEDAVYEIVNVKEMEDDLFIEAIKYLINN